MFLRVGSEGIFLFLLLFSISCPHLLLGFFMILWHVVSQFMFVFITLYIIEPFKVLVSLEINNTAIVIILL